MEFKDYKFYLFRVKHDMLWFYSNQAVATKGLQKWFTTDAIRALYENGYIEIISEIIPKKNDNALDGLCKIHNENMEAENEQNDQRPLTFGEKAVGLNFNPGGNLAVDECKKTFAKAIDQMNDLRNDPITTPEAKRLASVAITELQGAQMWAVKAITWRD
jgi:hypothetical protein